MAERGARHLDEQFMGLWCRDGDLVEVELVVAGITVYSVSTADVRCIGNVLLLREHGLLLD